MGGGRYLGGKRGGRDGRFMDFGEGWNAVKKSTQFYNDNSNFQTWFNGGMRGEEYDSIKAYTGESGMSYHVVNKALYTQDYEDMNPQTQKAVDNIVSGLNKFELLKGIQVTRQCDFKIFGAPSGKKMTIDQIKDFIKKNADPKDGTLENKGLLSFGSNNHGAEIDGSGLVIHAKVPPSVGAGAYINPLSKHGGSYENEWLFNAHSKFKFDISSLRKDSEGKIHINAVWKGKKRHK